MNNKVQINNGRKTALRKLPVLRFLKNSDRIDKIIAFMI